MADIAPETIIAKFDLDADQWTAWFAPTPQVAFGGDLPARRCGGGWKAQLRLQTPPPGM